MRIVLLFALCALAGCGSTSATGKVAGAPGFSGYHVDNEGALTAHTLAPTWPTSATVDESGLDLLSGQPTSNMGFTLPDGAFVGIQSTSNVEGKDWVVTVGDVSINLGEIGIDRAAPIEAMRAQIEPLTDAIVQALITTGQIAADQAEAATGIVQAAVEGIIEGIKPPGT